MKDYQFKIEGPDEDGDYMATCPDFPGLSAFGDTEEEALKEGRIALGGMIEVCRERGIPLP